MTCVIDVGGYIFSHRLRLHFFGRFLSVVKRAVLLLPDRYFSLCVCASVHLCICASVHLCVCASVHLCICVSVYLCICASVHLCICVSVCVSVCICVHINNNLLCWQSMESGDLAGIFDLQ